MPRRSSFNEVDHRSGNPRRGGRRGVGAGDDIIGDRHYHEHIDVVTGSAAVQSYGAEIPKDGS